jgi:hypothetical protein
MAENRWLIVTGAVVLVLMLLIGAFSLGVYVGRHGLSPEGLRYQTVQPAAPALGEPGGGPAELPQGLPAGPPDGTGRIRGRSAAGIELATQEGPRLVEVDQSTQVTDMQGTSLTLADLQRGDIVAVYGRIAFGDGQRLIATLIVRLPPRLPTQP